MSNITAFLLDRSGSMGTGIGDTIAAFNAYIENLRSEPELGIKFSLLMFDSIGIDKLCTDVDVKDAPLLSLESYQPRGATPLVDSAYETIKAVERKIAADDKVVIVIQTDGQENCSKDWTFVQLNELIRQKTEQGWQFVFMGAGIDSYATADQMGLRKDQTLSYDRTKGVTVAAAFAATGRATRDYMSGRLQATAYSADEKRKSGDAFDPDLQKESNRNAQAAAGSRVNL